MANCIFCKREIPQGTGKMFVRKNGKIQWFCSSKCEKNLLKLKRNPSKIEWAKKSTKNK